MGQNFLIDRNIKDKIIKASELKPDDTVLEIGPGFGALTFDIARRAKRVIAVEKDRLIVNIMSGMMKEAGITNVTFINADILKTPLGDILPKKRVKVIGNLPYYATSPIITFLLDAKRYFSSLLVTVQREVAQRLLAGPHSKEYGAISCFVQYHTLPRYVYTIKRGSFFPVPDVDSSLVKLTVTDQPSVPVVNETSFFRIIRTSFQQRRKVIVNALIAAVDRPVTKETLADMLDKCGIDKRARPEDLSLRDFAKITNALYK